MIKALYQRLKEMDATDFEDLCFQIWSEKLSGIALRHVEGKAGDKGADLFAGSLRSGAAVWQCKFFKDGIKDAQKKQIKKSLKTAVTHLNPRLWTLCVPIKLDINAHAWLQKLTSLYSPKLKIELFDGPMIVKELIFRTPIRVAFFPGAILEVEEIRAMLRGTGNYTDTQLAKEADESVEEYIERLRQRDPRYDYQVSYSSGNAGLARATPPITLPTPNTVLSMRRGNRQLDLVARDIEALQKDPPKIALELSAHGLEKIQHALSSGTPAHLAHGELIGFQSSFDFLMSPEELKQPHEAYVVPRFFRVTAFFRVTFARGDQTIAYERIEFAITKTLNGIECRSTTTAQIPFSLALSLDTDRNVYNFDLTTSFTGHDILEVQKCFRAVELLRTGGTLELFELSKAQKIGPLPVEITKTSEEREEFERLTDQLAEVSRAFGQTIAAPEFIDGKSIENLAFLLEVSRRGEITGGTVDNLTAKLVRDERDAKEVLGQFQNDFSVAFENDGNTPLKLLGVDFFVGPSRIIVENARIVDFDRVRTDFEALSPGESIPLRFVASGPVRQVFNRFYKGEPLPPPKIP